MSTLWISPLITLISFSSGVLAQGLPEPSLILYGTIRNTAGFNSRVTSGTLNWTFTRQEGTPRTNVLSTILTNLIGQFSYVLEVPCESSLSGAVSSNVLELLSAPFDFNRSQVTLDGAPLAFIVTTQAIVRLSSRSRGTIERVDFTIDAPCLDLDGRGLCDSWEILFFGNTGHFAAADDDTDGMTNLQEYIAGTNPSDRNSFFQFISYSFIPEVGFEVKWKSAEGRSYSLLRSSTPLPGSFSVIRSNLVATGAEYGFIDATAFPPGPYFYSVRIEP